MYFHCAREGRKIDILKKNDRVCIEVDIDTASYGARRLAGGQQNTGA